MPPLTRPRQIRASWPISMSITSYLYIIQVTRDPSRLLTVFPSLPFLYLTLFPLINFSSSLPFLVYIRVEKRPGRHVFKPRIKLFPPKPRASPIALRNLRLHPSGPSLQLPALTACAPLFQPHRSQIRPRKNDGRQSRKLTDPLNFGLSFSLCFSFLHLPPSSIPSIRERNNE